MLLKRVKRFSQAQPPPFTEIPEAATFNGLVASPKVSQAAPGATDNAFGTFRSMVRDVQEFLEDPRPAGKKLFAKQRSMGDLKEYDADGYSTRAVAVVEYPAPSSTEDSRS